MDIKDINDFGTIDQEFNSVIDDLFIEEEILSDADIDNVSSRISLKFLNYITKQMILQRRNRSIRKEITMPDHDNNRVVITMGRSQMLKTALDLLKSIDNELYVETLKGLIGLRDNEEIVIYNYYSVQDFSKCDERGFKEFERKSMRMSDKGRSKIYLVLMENLNREDALNLNKIIQSGDVCSFEDLFKFIHEIAHGFDKNYEQCSVVNVEKYPGEQPLNGDDLPKTAETYLSETTAIFFENVLGDYLISKNPKNRVVVEQILRDRIISNRSLTELVGFKTSLMMDKEENSLVSDERTRDIAAAFGMTLEEGKESVTETPFLYSDRKYVLAELFVPTMIKKYKENKEEGNKRILNYLNAVKNNDFKGALLAFDITLNRAGLEELLKNLKEYESRYLHDFDFTDVGGR